MEWYWITIMTVYAVVSLYIAFISITLPKLYGFRTRGLLLSVVWPIIMTAAIIFAPFALFMEQEE